jgi:23S rRNA pseudouridine2605 synthase
LLLLTDDGELAFRLMHPRFEIKKRYEVLVKGAPAPAKVDRLRRGITLEDGKTSPAQVRVRQRRRVGRAVETRLGICIHEGRKRQVKRMFEAIGHPAQTLERVEFAGLTLEGLRPGQWRRLRDREVRQLRSQVGLRSCLEIPGEPKV